jgi:hypothetical protein
MKLHLASPATSSRRNVAVRSNPVRLGTLALAVIFTASQMPAQPAPAATPVAATQQVADDTASTVQTPVTNTAAAVSTASSDGLKSESNALPEAPAATASNEETASVTVPSNMRAMLSDAAQQSQSLQSPKSASKGIQRPGMLVMGIVGLPIAALGAWALSVGVTKDAAAKNIFGGALLGGGGLMVGFGFTYAFKAKTN